MLRKELAAYIVDELEPHDLRTQIEVLANVFLTIGIREINNEGTNLGPLTMETVTSLVVEDKRSRGETLGNSLASQGLALLMWLEE